MKFLQLTVLFVAFAANSAIEFDRECRSLPVVEDFDMQKVRAKSNQFHFKLLNLFFQYAGNWYEVMRYDSSLQKNGDCSTFDYAYDFELEMVMDLNVTHHWRYLANGTSVYRYGVLSYMGDHPHVDRHHHNEGHLELTFNDDPHNPIHYCLVASDYENYALVWACETLPNGRSNGEIGT